MVLPGHFGRSMRATGMNVKAVFFDAGNTLIYPEPPVGEVYARALGKAGIRADAGDVERQFLEAWARLRRQHGPGRPGYGSGEPEAMDWWRRVVRESFRPFGLPGDFEDLFLALWEHFAAGSAWRVYDDVWPTFDALRRLGIRIGLISNWDVRLPRLLRELGIARHLDWTIISFEAGAEKPDGAIFRKAVQGCGFPAGQIAHVGDTYEEDVLGARGAGIQGVWLRRDEAEPALADAPAIKQLTELPRVLT